jgi:urease accessory protein
MLAAPADFPMQRAQGRAFVAFGAGNRLADLAQQGSAKAMLPRVSGPPEVVFLNTSGGLTDGDRLSYQLDIAAGCRITATTQTAERAYASRGAPAVAEVTATLGAGARLDWLPQETILFEDSHLHRSTTINLAGDAACLLVESVVLGRHAMGETLTRARLTDRRLVLRDARPVWAETLDITPEFLATANAALLGEARAFAVIALIAPHAEDALPTLRATLTHQGCDSAASGWDGKCIARILARDGWPLKQQIATALAALRAGPLPRVWQL